MPSLEQIREACEAIRLEWDEELRRRPSTVKHWRPPGMTTADVEGARGETIDAATLQMDHASVQPNDN